MGRQQLADFGLGYGRGGRWGDPQRYAVNGIKQLVAKSVPELETDQVAVVDTNGNALQSLEDTTQMRLT